MFRPRPYQSPADKAATVARIRRIGLIVAGIGVEIVYAELAIGCALVRRACAPALPVVSAVVCVALLVLLLLVRRNKSEQWPLTTLATGLVLSMACLPFLLAAMP